jgi:hypothetical protein
MGPIRWYAIRNYAAKHLSVASTTIPRFKSEILQYSYRQQNTHRISLWGTTFFHLYSPSECHPWWKWCKAQCSSGDARVVGDKERVALPKDVGQLGGDSSNYLPCVVLMYGLPLHRLCICRRSPPLSNSKLSALRGPYHGIAFTADTCSWGQRVGGRHFIPRSEVGWWIIT